MVVTHCWMLARRGGKKLGLDPYIRFASEYVVANHFQADRQMSGGWIKTEEETSLKNHLRWARYKVRGDGSEVSREKEMESDGSLSPSSLIQDVN